MKSFCFVSFLFSVCLPVYAGTVSSPQDDFSNNLRLATQKFEQNDYSAAKEYFERALEYALVQREPTSSIYYNLGSVCYRLKLYGQSKQYFKKLIDHQQLQAVAYYNLALIENKQSRKKAALDNLYKSKKYSSDKQLSKLVDQQIFKLSSKKPDRTIKKTIKDWHAYLYLSPGYDSNIRFAPLEIASNETGNFIQGVGIFDKRIAGDGYGIKKSALLVTSSIFLSNYYSTDFNDYNLYDVGLRYLEPVKKWRNTIEFNLKRSTYGHRDYQQTYVATFKTKRIYSDGNVLRLRYRFEQIESLDALFEYLEGNRQRLRAGYQFKWPADSIFTWYELEFNNRNNTVRRNYSPTRNSLRVRYEKKFNATNKVYTEMAYRHSDYDTTPTQDRRDNRTDYLLAYIYKPAPDWQLQTRWGFRTNRSSESIFSYDRHIILLTLRLTL